MTSSEPAGARTRNRLAGSTSPYLRQHAHNPVDWYEWGPEALGRARQEGKPIFLSVGYSACHWCHVMAHESFEDERIAELMNEWFINIKVDREERPDIDAIYQRVVQLMGEGGGWPLSVFLTPDQRPFYGGTYFPPTSRYGRPGFADLLRALHEAFTARPEEIEKQAGSFMDGLTQLAGMVEEDARHTGEPDALWGRDALRHASRRLAARVDPKCGGFGNAPKFPNPTALEIFLRMARGDQRQEDAREASDALRLTLDRMYRGGIYDHLRGGFARYAVDRVWLTPHFEKMLYDNAQLLGLYAEAAVLWPDPALRRAVTETVTYLVADMRDDDGLYFAATDADSEGEEGKYFVWTPQQVLEVLGEDLAIPFMQVHDVTPEGNFEHGTSILNLPLSIAEQARALGVPQEELEGLLSRARTKLLEARYSRIPPHLDAKILTSWNALVISGLVRAAAAAEAWGDPNRARGWRDLARVAGERLLEAHVTDDGHVQRAAFEGKVHTRGYLDDVAFLARACLDLHEATLRSSWLEAAARLARHGMERYGRDGGGFFLTADDAETLIQRTESQHDAAIPSGVGVMVEVLLRLDAGGVAPAGARERAEETLARFRGAGSNPFAHASLLLAATWARADAVQVTVRGPDPGDAVVMELARCARETRLRIPAAVGLAFEAAERASAVVCRGQACTTPLTDTASLAREIGR